MSLPAALLLVLYGIIVFSFTQGQQRGYDLTFSRPIPGDLNIILLVCVNTADGSLNLDTDFFRNGLIYNNLPDRANVPGLGVRFVVDRLSEGNFTCGVAGLTSVPARTIVARPESIDLQEEQTSYADVGSTARLDCSITPGALLSLYYVTWRSASDPSVIFYQIFPPLRNGQQETFNPDTRYSIDVRNFSLFISNAGFADAADNYQCVLGVVDPRTDQAYEYTQTSDLNISLSIFKAPQFVEEPTSLVVRNGTDVTFSCAVVSSPKESSFVWRLGSRTLDRDSDRISITPVVVSVEGGKKRTTSSLAIADVTGLDSDTVECFSQYSGNTGAIVSTVRSTATLNVLDAVQLNPPIPFQSGGFIFPIIPKHPLLLPVMVTLLYTDTETGARTPVRSIATYYNTTPIYHIAFNEKVPPYNRFYLGVALFYKEVEGPMIQSKNVFNRRSYVNDTGQTGQSSESSSRGLNMALWVVCTLLILLILAIVTIFIVTQLRTACFRMKNPMLKEAVRELKQLTSAADRPNIICCSCHNNGPQHEENHKKQPSNETDGDESMNEPVHGFDLKMAEKFAFSLDKTIKFGEGNTVIARVMRERKMISGPA